MQVRTWSLTLVALLAPISASAGTFTETFTTTTYKDVANTTAEWNTVDGELRIPSFTPTLVGSYDTPGSADGVAVDGNFAFVADRASGLQVLDVTNPASPMLLGAYDTPGFATAVAVAGDLAFVADQTSLQIIDVTNPAAPSFVGTYNTPANRVAVSGDLAFVASGAAGLLIIDITDPAAPWRRSFYVTPGNALGVAVAGDLAFVAVQSAGLLILNVANPAIPTLVATFDTPDAADDVAVAGNLVFVADRASGLQIIDITNPGAPVLAGSYNTPGSALGVCVSGDRVFVADGIGGLHALDLAYPGSPALVGTFIPPIPSLVRGVVVAGDRAFVANDAAGLRTIRIATPISPWLAGTYDAPGGNSGDLVIDGNHVLVNDSGAVRIIDVADPTAPTLVGAYTSANIGGVAVAGDLAFVGKLIRLEILDISNPASPTYLGGVNYSEGSIASAVVVAGDHAFVTDVLSGLWVISIANPSAPVVTGNYSAPGSANGLAVAGDVAFVAYGSTSGLVAVNIRNPGNPTLLGSYDTPGIARDVTVSGDLAFVADDAAGVQILDISNPASPTLVSTFNTPGAALDIAVAGDFAFVADGTGGVHVLDITNPANPTSLGVYDTPGTAGGIVAAGDHVFAADGAIDLQVIQMFQHDVNAFTAVGQSLPINGLDETILRARLTSTMQSGDVTWQLSANSGSNFQSVTPGPNWTLFTSPGNDLVWRSSHTWSEPGDDPTVSEATLEWLHESAVITSIADVPNDQGRKVRLTWTRSGRDFPGDAQQITRYGVYRRNDAAGWDFITTVPVLLDDSYSVVVPTLGDSTIVDGDHQTVFRVTAFTASPDVYFQSPPDSGYSLDNLPPNVPQGFAATHGAGAVDLVWGSAPEADFRLFRIYRSTLPDFTPGTETLVHETEITSWQDASAIPGTRYYKLTAVDGAGNESDPASTNLETSLGEGSTLPVTFALRTATPNPARTLTHIAFDLPAQVAVSLRVYDVSGRVVRTLAQDRMLAGAHVVAWDGRDASGRRVPAGVYLYRLQAADFESTGRLTLIR